MGEVSVAPLALLTIVDGYSEDDSRFAPKTLDLIFLPVTFGLENNPHSDLKAT